MKRLGLLFVLCLALLLSACADELHPMTLTAEGDLVDGESGIAYREQDVCFEASRAGDEVGVLADGDVLYAIPDLDQGLFLTDAYGTVYYANGELTLSALGTVDTVLVCRVVGEMDEVVRRLYARDDAAHVAAICAAWENGEDLGSDVFLLEEVTAYYPVKLGSSTCPNLYYAIELRFAESGAYLTDKYGKHTVKLEDTLAALLRGEG